MLDNLQIIFWSCTYICIVFSGIKSIASSEYKIAMPYAAGILNFAWEICAINYSNGFWGHVLWLGLDIIIVYISYLFIRKKRNKWLYALTIVISVALLWMVFMYPNGITISVFIIDLIMAIVFVANHRSISVHLKKSIAVLKLIGDAFAGLCYFQHSILVAVIAVIVFICNIIYVYLCFKKVNK